MEKTALLDSSVWIAYFSERDLHHQKAQKIIESLRQNHFIIYLPDIVYIETLNVLKRNSWDHLKLQTVKSHLENYVLNRFVRLNKKHFKRDVYKILLIYKLKSLDLLIFVFVIIFNANEFYSFDKKLLKAYKKYKDDKIQPHEKYS